MDNALVILGLGFGMYITGPALRYEFEQWLRRQRPEPKEAGKPEPAPTSQPVVNNFPVFPEKLQAYIASWQPAWAQEDVEMRAKRLWLEHQNWEVVYAELLRQDGEKDG